MPKNSYTKPPKSSNTYAEGGEVKVQDIPPNNVIWRHHKNNLDNKTAVRNPDGSVSTVKTIILGDGEFEYLIPTVWEGKILSDDEAWEKAMSSGVDWPKAPAGKEGVEALEMLDEVLHRGMTAEGYAEGGEVEPMEKQMSLFEHGGLADDGVEVEPTTGNEVPPGSLEEEVKDDIDAKLSEGEYVVPADVVRYYGVKFFEDLRNEAKSGMMSMEQEGRIGGEPMQEPVGGESLTQEELAFLEQVMAAEQPPMEGQPMQMAEGGSVQTSFNPTNYQMGFSDTGFGGFKGFNYENRTYSNAAGDTLIITFLNGKPLQPIPEGYSPGTGGSKEASEQKKVEVTPAGERDDTTIDSLPERDTGPTKPSYGLGDMGKFGTGALGALGGGVLAGPTGALAGSKIGAQAGAFNSARNNLVDALISGDEDAIAKAEEAVGSTYEDLGKGAQLLVGGEGSSVSDALKHVRDQVSEFLGATQKSDKVETPEVPQTPTKESIAQKEETLKGEYQGTTDEGVDIFTPTSGTVRPKARPTGLGGEPNSNSNQGTGNFLEDLQGFFGKK